MPSDRADGDTVVRPDPHGAADRALIERRRLVETGLGGDRPAAGRKGQRRHRADLAWHESVAPDEKADLAHRVCIAVRRLEGSLLAAHRCRLEGDDADVLGDDLAGPRARCSAAEDRGRSRVEVGGMREQEDLAGAPTVSGGRAGEHQVPAAAEGKAATHRSGGRAARRVAQHALGEDRPVPRGDGEAGQRPEAVAAQYRHGSGEFAGSHHRRPGSERGSGTHADRGRGQHGGAQHDRNDGPRDPARQKTNGHHEHPHTLGRRRPARGTTTARGAIFVPTGEPRTGRAAPIREALRHLQQGGPAAAWSMKRGTATPPPRRCRRARLRT